MDPSRSPDKSKDEKSEKKLTTRSLLVLPEVHRVVAGSRPQGGAFRAMPMTSFGPSLVSTRGGEIAGTGSGFASSSISRAVPPEAVARVPIVKEAQKFKGVTSQTPQVSSLYFPPPLKGIVEKKVRPIVRDEFTVNKNFGWTNPESKRLPFSYPVERSNCILPKKDGYELKGVCARVAECFRVTSVQARFFDIPASAALLTPELVEIYLSFWTVKSPRMGEGIQVEIQRRKGDSVIFHRYVQYILQAARGEFDSEEYRRVHVSESGSMSFLKSAQDVLRNELMLAKIDEHKEALKSLRLVFHLLGKDRLDARMLGLESLVLLTNPRKTLVNASIIASRVVLFGSSREGSRETAVFDGIHEMILTIVQKRCMVNEEALVKDMSTERDSDEEEFFESDEEEDIREHRPPEYADGMSTALNLSLTILSNALDVLRTFGLEPDKTAGNVDLNSLARDFLKKAAETTGADIIESLIHQVGRAGVKPHNASMAAKSLRVLCRLTPVAIDRAHKYGAVKVAKNAREIGIMSHALLEKESDGFVSLCTGTRSRPI